MLFTPTHRITYTPTTGTPQVWDVMVADDGTAYTQEEWEATASADWEYGTDGRFLFRGQAAPGNGTVVVERLIDHGDADGDADIIDAEEDHLDAIRRMAYGDIARDIQQHGIRLTWAQEEECGEEALDWLRQRLGLTATTDSDGVTYRRES